MVAPKQADHRVGAPVVVDHLGAVHHHRAVVKEHVAEQGRRETVRHHLLVVEAHLHGEDLPLRTDHPPHRGRQLRLGGHLAAEAVLRQLTELAGHQPREAQQRPPIVAAVLAALLVADGVPGAGEEEPVKGGGAAKGGALLGEFSLKMGKEAVQEDLADVLLLLVDVGKEHHLIFHLQLLHQVDHANAVLGEGVIRLLVELAPTYEAKKR